MDSRGLRDQALNERMQQRFAALDDLCALTRGARDVVWPAQLADGLVPLNRIDQILEIDLHRWTPGMGREMGCDEFTTSSHPRPWNST